MKKNELMKYALTAGNLQIKLENNCNECYLYLPTPILEQNNMFGPDIRSKYAKINAKNFFVQKRKCLVERNCLDYALFYSLLREVREQRGGRVRTRVRNDSVADRPADKDGGKTSGDAVLSTKSDSDGFSVDNYPISRTNLSRKPHKLRISRTKALLAEIWYGNHCKRRSNDLFLTSMADPLVVIGALLGTKHFSKFVYMEKEAIKINGLRLNRNTNWYKLFHFSLLNVNSIGIRNILNLGDEKLSMMLYMQNKSRSDVLEHMVIMDLDLARKIVLCYNDAEKEMHKLYVTECEKRANKKCVVEFLNCSNIENISPDIFYLYRKYEKNVDLAKIIELKDYIDRAENSTCDSIKDMVVRCKELYSFFISSESMTSDESRVKEVFSAELCQEVADETKKMLCRLVKSNIEFISNGLNELNTKSRRTVMRQIVTESWEHMLPMYSDLVCMQDDLNRFIFEYELFNYIVEAGKHTMPGDAKEMERKNILRMRKAAKFIDVLKFKDPSKSILLNMLRVYLERSLSKKRYGMVNVLRAYLNKRNDFDYTLLQNFRNNIFKMNSVKLKQKIALVDLYYELVRDVNTKQRDLSINFQEIMTRSTSNPLNYSRLTPLEIKHVEFGPDVVRYIESFRGKVFERFFDAKNFILFTSHFLGNLTDLEWIENSLHSIKSSREDLNVMVESLISQVKIRISVRGDVMVTTASKETDKRSAVAEGNVKRTNSTQEEQKKTTYTQHMPRSIDVEGAFRSSFVRQPRDRYQANPKNYKKCTEKEIEPGEIVCGTRETRGNASVYEHDRSAAYRYEESSQYDERSDHGDKKYCKSRNDSRINNREASWDGNERVERDEDRSRSYVYRGREREYGGNRRTDRRSSYYNTLPHENGSEIGSLRNVRSETNYRASPAYVENERTDNFGSEPRGHNRGNFNNSYSSHGGRDREPCNSNTWRAGYQAEYTQRTRGNNYCGRGDFDERRVDRYNDRGRNECGRPYDERTYEHADYRRYDDDNRNYDRESDYSWSRYGRRDRDRSPDEYSNERARRKRREY